MADLLDRFFDEVVPARLESGRMAPHTVAIYTSQARLYVRPLLGSYKVAALKRGDVEAFAGRIKSLSQRERTLQLLSRLFTQAERWEWRPEHSNPCRLVERAVERPRERVLAPSELSALADALDVLEGKQRAPVAAIKTAAMTGLRISEALGMEWARVSLETGRATLDTKTGPRVVPWRRPWWELLRAMPKRAGNPWVFPSGRKAHVSTGGPGACSWRPARWPGSLTCGSMTCAGPGHPAGRRGSQLLHAARRARATGPLPCPTATSSRRVTHSRRRPRRRRR